MKYQKILYFLQNVGKDPSALMSEDYLTGLNNRRFLLSFLKNKIDWNTLKAHPVSLLMLDIDHHKRINDQYGHGVGDQALIHIATILKKISQKKGIPILYAGDEFMLLLPDTGKKEALAKGKELIRQTNENLFFSAEAGTEIPITVSIGIASAPDDAGAGDALIQQAKNALYHAKQSGRNRYVDAGTVSRQAVQYLDTAGIVGRKFQFEQVSKALKEVGEGKSRFIIVDGAPGMGKTSFLDSIQRNLEKTKLNPIRVGGVAQESLRPYYLVTYIVMELMNQKEDKGIGILEAMHEKDVDLLAYILPQLKDSEALSPADEAGQRELIFRSFIRFLTSLVGNRPLVLLIDDLHYSDPASLHLLRVIIMAKTIRLFICGTASEEKQTKPKAIPLDLFRTAYSESLEIQDVRLTPLTVKDIEKHINIIFPGISMPQRLIKELVQLTQGNPLFILELLRKMVTDQKIVQSQNRWRVIHLEKRYFPNSLEEIILKKMAFLDDESKRFLECAAAFGESISLSMLTGSYNEKSSKIHDFLNQVVDQGIVKSDFKENDENIRFSSKKVREIIYDGIQAEQKKNLHEEIGNYQETLYKQDLLPAASFLAYQFQRSNNHEKAEAYTRLQEDHNKRVFNIKEATAYSEDEAEDKGLEGAEEIGDVPLSEEGLRHVPKMLRAILLAVRNSRLYPPESKAVVGSLQQLKQRVDQILKGVERFSIIVQKRAILINGQEIDPRGFESLAEKIVVFWDWLQLKSLTFIRGFAEKELKAVLEKFSHVEKKEIISPIFWQKFIEENRISKIYPRQVKYVKIDPDSVDMGAETIDALMASVSYEPGDAESLEERLEDKDVAIIKQVIGAMMSAYSKFKLYPPDGPVAKKAIEKVVSELKVFFKKQPVLTIARVERSLLVNDYKIDTTRFETLADGLLSFFKETRLNSITFLEQVSLRDLLEFFAASSRPAAADQDADFWQATVKEKRISGILLDQRIYSVAEEVPGDDADAEDFDLAGDALVSGEIPFEALDLETLPQKLRDLLLTGKKKAAGILLDRLCEMYTASDTPGRNEITEVFTSLLKPADWRPSAAYIKFVLTSMIPLFQAETDSSLIARIADLFQHCAATFIFFSEYALATWVYSQLQQQPAYAGADPMEKWDGINFFEKTMDPRIADAITEDLKSEDRNRQQEAFQLLSAMGGQTLPILIDIIKRESNLRVRRLAAQLLKDQGAKGVDLLKSALMAESRPEYRARILDVIDSVTTDLMAELTDTFSDTKDVVRRAAFRLAERLNTPGVIALFIEYARGDDADLAVSAINSLGNLRSSSSVPALMKILEKTDNKEKLIAVCRAMGQIGDASCIEPLTKTLMPRRWFLFKKKHDAPVRVAAAYALSRFADRRVTALLKSLADDPDYRVREVVKHLNHSVSK